MYFIKVTDIPLQQGRGDRVEPRVLGRTQLFFQELKSITQLTSSDKLAAWINDRLNDVHDGAISRQSIDNYLTAKTHFEDEILKSDIILAVAEGLGDGPAKHLDEIWNSPIWLAMSSAYEMVEITIRKSVANEISERYYSICLATNCIIKTAIKMVTPPFRPTWNSVDDDYALWEEADDQMRSSMLFLRSLSCDPIFGRAMQNPLIGKPRYREWFFVLLADQIDWEFKRLDPAIDTMEIDDFRAEFLRRAGLCVDLCPCSAMEGRSCWIAKVKAL